MLLKRPEYSAMICVVDDDEAVLDSLSLLLEAEGYRVKAVGSGLALLTEVDLSSCQCVLLDLRLPDASGIDVLRDLRAKQKELPVIMVTGHGDVPLAVKAMKEGAFDFIEKPHNDQVLLERIGDAISHDRSVVSNPLNEIFTYLTPREQDVLRQLLIGRPNKIIARELGISPRTVEVHRARVMEKTEAKSLSHLVRMALAAGIDPGVPA